MLYDELYIGSGPLNCLAAARSVERGKTVKMVDGRSTPFGAWGTMEVLGSPVEIGCHIWSRVPSCYHFLEMRLDIALEEMHPAPMLITNKGDLHYDRKWLPYNLKRLYQRARRNPADLKNLVGSASFRLPIIPRSYSYPERGAVELGEGLGKLLERFDIEPELDCEIKQMSWKGNHWDLDGRYQAKKVFLTTTSQSEGIFMGDERITLTHERQTFYHIHMQLAKSLDKPLSYWRVMGHPSIHRISDVTPQMEQLGEGSMILFGVHESAMGQSDEDLCKQAVELLSSRGITSDNKVVSIHHNTFHVDRLDNESLSKLADLPQLEVIHSSDLMFGLFELLKKDRV